MKPLLTLKSRPAAALLQRLSQLAAAALVGSVLFSSVARAGTVTVVTSFPRS